MSRTFSSILWDKVLDSVERSSWFDMFITGAKVFCWLVICFSLVDIRTAGDTFLSVVRWADYGILKFLGAFFVVFGGRWYICAFSSLARYVGEIIDDLRVVDTDEPLFYGIPVVELVEYMFSGRGFVRSDIERIFAIPRNKFDEMAKKLDDVKVFVRGSNNARIPNPEMSREDISSILFAAAASGEVKRLVRKVENGYSHTPSMPALRSSSGFVTRPLSDFRASAS